MRRVTNITTASTRKRPTESRKQRVVLETEQEVEESVERHERRKHGRALTQAAEHRPRVAGNQQRS